MTNTILQKVSKHSVVYFESCRKQKILITLKVCINLKCRKCVPGACVSVATEPFPPLLTPHISIVWILFTGSNPPPFLNKDIYLNLL